MSRADCITVPDGPANGYWTGPGGAARVATVG
ncbi:MAG: hypothetical protein JWM49_693 [Microbacteriaceae bacterium]|nr:hypothetical protein [Microbacteriaceae bacterium]